MSCSSLKNNLRHIYLVQDFFFKNTSQGFEDTKLQLLRNVKCSIQILARLGHSAVLFLSITAIKFVFTENAEMC